MVSQVELNGYPISHEHIRGQARNACSLAIPPGPVPDSVLVPVHDLERSNRTLMPVLDLAENSLDVFGY